MRSFASLLAASLVLGVAMDADAQQTASPERAAEARLLVAALEAAGLTNDLASRLGPTPSPGPGRAIGGAAAFPTPTEWRALQTDVIAKRMPPERVREVRAQAYAETLTLEQLRAIRGFVESPVGHAFFAAQSSVNAKMSAHFAAALSDALTTWADSMPRPARNPPR